MNNLNQTIEENWEEIKEYIQSKWSKLTDNDLKKINGSYKELTGKLQDLYGYKIAEVHHEINELLESNGLNKAKTKMEEIKKIVFDTLDEYFQSAKQKSVETEKAIMQYATDNPFKFIGLAATAGLMIGCLCKSKRN